MFFISMPDTFKIGDTEACRINGQPAKIKWRDADTLVILPDDTRPILAVEKAGNLISFTCGHQGETKANYVTETLPGGGVLRYWLGK